MIRAPTIWLRREPTTDRVLLAARPDGAGKFDTVAYSGPAMARAVARWPWYARQPRQPRRRPAPIYLTLNCARWRGVWGRSP